MSEGLELISAILERGSTVTFRLLEPDIFVGQDERDVFEFVREHFRRHSELPLVETVEENVDLDLPDAPEHVDYYLDQIWSRSMYNAVRDPFNLMRDALVTRDNERVRDLASEIYAACRESNREHDLRNLGDLVSEASHMYHENLLLEGMSGIPTGWQTLDRETAGYQNGDLIVWVARPGLGKTHLLIHQAKTAWMSGKSVLFVTMEMSMLQITNRFIGHYASINPEYIRRGQLSTFMKRRFDDAVAQLDSDRRFHMFAGNMGKRADDVDLLIQELNPDIIYIDGMYLLKPSESNKVRNRFDAVAYVLDEIKTMTITRDRPIVTTTQFSRGAGKGGREGSLETIGYTDAIATHASVIPVILPPNRKRQRAYGTNRFREIAILKGREGETTGFNVAYNFRPMEFFELITPLEDRLGRDVQQETNEQDQEEGAPEHIRRTRQDDWHEGNRRDRRRRQ